MFLVAVDTSGKNGSLTLARAEPGSVGGVATLETVALEGGTFSAQLIPQFAELLARHGISKQAVGAFAVASGPGSFTGLRIGLAAVKGLAEALATPVVAVSLLEAIAHQSSESHLLVALDAGRNELYVGDYASGLLLGDEQVMGRLAFLDYAEKKVLTIDERLARELSERSKPVELVIHPGSVGVARLGWEKLRAGLTITPEQLDANYVRRSDADIFSSPQTSRS